MGLSVLAFTLGLPVVARPATFTSMLIPKKNRVDIYSYLFKEGVICAKEDWSKEKHDEIEVPNAHVLKLLQSLKSRNLVKNQYAWQWQYYYITDEGIEYLREYLHLPAEIVPATLKKATRPPMDGRPGGFGDGKGKGKGESRGFGGDRDGYRGGGGRGFGKGKDGDDKKPGGPGEGFAPSYAGGGKGFGRGGAK